MRNETLKRWVLIVLPAALLGGVLFVFQQVDPLSSLRRDQPAIEELSFRRVTLTVEPRKILVSVVNAGPEPVTIAQVLVDEAYWPHSVAPDRTLQRLESARVVIPYPWVDGEAHGLTLVTSTGITFHHFIEVAVETPQPGGAALGRLAVIGVFVGVIPVFIGLAWFPLVRRLAQRWIGLLLAFTGGILLFLGIEALAEAVELAAVVAAPFQGIGLITLGATSTIAVLSAVSHWSRTRRDGSATLVVAALISLGIGLHNMGEGLAIGSAYALGELGLTTFLVTGFMLHNVTEGLAIVAPLSQTRVRIRTLVLLGALAGMPTVAGAWLGSLAYDPVWATLFIAMGVGAIAQVVWELARHIRSTPRALEPGLISAGFVLGLLVMYGTGLAIA